MLQLFFLILAIVNPRVPQLPPPAPTAIPVPETGGAAASTASPREQPLKEIGRVTSSAVCTNIVVRANSAIGAALRNDQTVGMAVATLRRVDLDGNNAIEKNKGIREIDRLAADLRASAGNADGQIRRLREMSEQASDPVRKADLREFADALGGALQRQKRIGIDMQRMLAIMEGRDAKAEIHEVIGHFQPEYRPVFGVFDRNMDTKNYNTMAREAAKDLEDRTNAILADEAKAAEHVAGAVNGC